MRLQSTVLFVSILSLSGGVRAGDSDRLQVLLDATAKTGGVVQLEAKRYTIDKAISIPEGVTLAGVWQAPHQSQLERGTVFEITANKGEEDGPPAILLNPSTCVKGITFYYPEQTVPNVVAYPWTIQGKGVHGSVIDCTFVNPYRMIDFGTYHNECHYIRNCFGCPLKVGIHIDQCSDIGRIENVHFNPNYWTQVGGSRRINGKALREYMWNNLIAFEFGRTDWEYVLNTFTFGAKVGYRFYENKGQGGVRGTVNGNFLGIGADWAHRAVLVETCQDPGLQITNGEFVGGEGSDAFVEVQGSNRGPVNFSNCSFWGPCPKIALLNGNGGTSFSQCTFLNQGPRTDPMFTILAQSGDLIVQACRFNIECPDIYLGPRVRTAAITGNWFRGSKEIENQSRGDVQEAANVVSRPSSRPS